MPLAGIVPFLLLLGSCFESLRELRDAVTCARLFVNSLIGEILVRDPSCFCYLKLPGSNFLRFNADENLPLSVWQHL